MHESWNEPWLPSAAAITDQDIQQCPVLVVHYWARWNMYDRDMDARLAQVRAEYVDRICFRSCDVDSPENQRFVHGVGNVPALGCFLNGDWLETVIGYQNIDLRSQLDEWLGKVRR